MLGHDATADLVTRAQRGESAALAGLAREFLRPAYSVALAVVGRPADAEDVAQDALAHALERIEACREPRAFTAWVLQIVRNRARNMLGSRRLRDAALKREPESSLGGHGHVVDIGLRHRLVAALALLTPIEREVVLLHDLEGWTHAEIALATGTTELMSRQHLFQARRELQSHLVDEEHREVKHGR